MNHLAFALGHLLDWMTSLSNWNQQVNWNPTRWKNGKASKNSSIYFDNKMFEEEEMEKQLDDGTFDECAYVKDDDNLCA